MWIAYLCLGAITGTMAGLTGLGGGIIVVPGLIMLFQLLRIPHDIILPLATGTSLVTTAFTGFASAYVHYQNQSIQFEMLKKILPGILSGTFIGSHAAVHLPHQSLQFCFGLLILCISLRSYSAAKTAREDPLLNPSVPATWKQILPVSCLIGAVCGMFGIGGGALMVPWLTALGFPMMHCFGTSISATIPVAMVGAASYALSGAADPNLIPQGATGFVLWPAVLPLAASSLSFATISARLAYRLPTQILKKIFSVLIMILGLYLIFDARR